MAERRLHGHLGASLLAALVVVVGGPAAARPPGPHGPPGGSPERFIEEEAARLGLDAETTERIRVISDAARTRSDELRHRLRAAHDTMRALLGAEEPDVNAVMAQAENISALELEDQKNRLRAMLEMRALLNPEQRAALAKDGANRRGRGRHAGPFGPCEKDVASLCGDGVVGAASLRCLAEEWNDVSRRCRAFVEEGRPPGRR